MTSDDLGLAQSPAQAAEGDVRTALAQASDMLSAHLERFHDYEDDTPAKDDLRGIMHHIDGSLMEDDALSAGAGVSVVTAPLSLDEGERVACVEGAERIVVEAIKRMRAAHVQCLDLTNDAEAFLRQRAALSAEGSATIATAQKPELMPIDSAPKDGTRFLAYERGRHFDCWWHYYAADQGYGWRDDADSEPDPTYWMPLPSSPEDQQKAAATPTIADPDGEARS